MHLASLLTVGRTRGRRGTAALSAALLTASMLSAFTLGSPAAVADTAPAAGEPATVSADPLPTVQINGVVWAQVAVGNTVYVTGQFTQARPAGVAVGGAGSVARSNLLAYNITTGALITGFNHSLNGQGRAIAASPDGSRLYVGGYFTTVDGVAHNRIAAFDTATGALDNSFTANLNNNVLALTATNSTVYAGGLFTTANGSNRSRLASYTAAGALNTWAPTADITVQSLAVVGSTVVVGGGFTTLNGVPRRGIGNVNATTGANGSWPSNYPIANSGTSATINSLTTDGTNVYGTGFSFSRGGNWEGRFSIDPTDGDINWMNSCHGDSYSAFPMGGVLYSASHEHDCSDIYSFTQDNTDPFVATPHRLAAEKITPNGKVARSPVYGLPMYDDFRGEPITDQLNWYPQLTAGTFTGQSQAAWSVTGNGTYLSVGGEFPSANGMAQQGLVRYALSSVAPDAIGPTTPAAPTVVSQSAGTLRVSWQAASDQDNTLLTYRLYRDGGATPIYTTTYDGAFWKRPMLGYTDTLTGSHNYRVRVTDPFGNTVLSGTSSTVAAGTAVVPSYAAMVRSDGAVNLWRLNEASGSTARDSATQPGNLTAGFNDMTLRSEVTFGAAGPIAGQGTAANFSGVLVQTPSTSGPPRTVTTSNSATGSIGDAMPLSTYTLEAWVRTSSTRGGIILSDSVHSPAPGGRLSPNVDRVLYVGDTGRVTFGAFDNNVNRTITSSGSVNDGQWHLVAATIGGGTGRLFVDGVQVATGDMDSTGVVVGKWRLGGDALYGWSPQPTSGFLAGQIADAAVYPTALSASRIQAHFAAAGGGTVNAAPTAVIAAPSCTDLACSFSGSGSTDSDGTITGYVWTFGDGGTATGVSPAHTYDAAGTYTVTLTVTDNGGATGSVTRSVTVTAGGAGNATPVAVIGAPSCTDLACSFNGSGSTDSDGTIASYAWTFGDGTTSNAANPSKTYTAAGTYTVTLTVTDNDGATGSVSRQVTVTAGGAGNAAPVAAFTSSCTGLVCSFTNGSTDIDGTIASSAWVFGDGTTSSATNPAKTYATAGTYTVTLTVTDDGGATNAASRTVTVTAAPAGQNFATDTFNRTVASGWGSADVGGSWTTSAAANFAVTPGAGSVNLPTAGSTQTAYLGSATSSSSDVTTTFALDKVPAGGSSGLYWDVIGRRVGTNQEYDGLVKVAPGGTISVGLRKLNGSSSAAMLTSNVATGLTAAAGTRVNVRFQVSGTNPTTLNLKVWLNNTTEPANWNLTVTDSSAGIQAAGSVGFRAYLSSSVTNGPIKASVTAFAAKPVA